MRYSFFFIAATLLAIACNKKDAAPPPIPTSYTLAQNPSWIKEDFKAQYSIQFPVSFTGGRELSSIGYLFSKYNATDSFFYAYMSDLLMFDDFGVKLKDSNALQFNCNALTSEMVRGGRVEEIFLPNRINFTNADTTVGIFYYDDKELSTGNLFWKAEPIPGFYYGYIETLYMYFKKENLPQVIEIIRTIQKK